MFVIYISYEDLLITEDSFNKYEGITPSADIISNGNHKKLWLSFQFPAGQVAGERLLGRRCVCLFIYPLHIKYLGYTFFK